MDGDTHGKEDKSILKMWYKICRKDTGVVGG
jgi:hypothetical protein